MTPERRTLLIGLAVFVVFALFTTGLSPIAPRVLERHLDAAAREALSAREFRWATVSVEGQVATLSGRWPDEAAHQSAIEAIFASEWSGGWLAGGITRIIDRSVRQEGEDESRLTAVLNENGLAVSGIAPDEATAGQISELANVLFPGRVEVRLTARSDGEAETAWFDAASQLLSGLSRLETGVGQLSTGSAVLYGAAQSEGQAVTAIASLEASPSSYAPAVLISAGAEQLGGIATVQECGQLISAASAMGRIRFNPGNAGLSAEAGNVLEHVAAVALACPQPEIIISVRPVVGGDNQAESLARARAEAVREALINAGLDAEAVTTAIETEQDQLVRIYPGRQGDG